MSEGSQRFEFDLRCWTDVVKYDDTDVHRALLRAVDGTKAVDFVALGNTDQPGVPRLALIEAKDFRLAHRENRARLKGGELAKEVARKVAGTLSGLSAGSRGQRSDFSWKRAGQLLTDSRKPMAVVIHVETADWCCIDDAKVALEVLERRIERELAWLPDCRVIACCEAIPRLRGCHVTTA